MRVPLALILIEVGTEPSENSCSGSEISDEVSCILSVKS